MDTKEQLYFLSMLNAIDDENRLAILRLTAQRECSITDITKTIGLSEAVITQHLKNLHGAGFLQLRMAENQRLYRFNAKQVDHLQRYIAQLGRPLTTKERPISDNRWIDALDISDEDKKILVGYTFNQKLTRFPTKDKQWFVVLRWIADKFEMDVRYSEKQVNTIITEVHEDYATIRRSLVEFGFMARERGGGDYWRIPKDDAML